MAATTEELLAEAFRLQHEGQLQEAEEICIGLLRDEPGNPLVHYRLGLIAAAGGRVGDAASSFARAVEIDPNLAAAHANLGETLRAKGDTAGAVASLQMAVELQPENADFSRSLGRALFDAGQIDEAIAAFERAVQISPDNLGLRLLLGSLLRQQGRIDEAITQFRSSVELAPHRADVHSDLLYTLHYHPAYDPAALFVEHRHWSALHADVPPIGRPAVERADDRLRVGYVSPDLGRHVVGQHLLPILRQHDRNRFEITCYSSRPEPDAVTEEIRAASEGWRDIAMLSDDEAAELIAQDGIDVLIDLSLHTAGNRLLVFARRPAPVQATYLGYCSTSGMDAMDYRLSDPFFDPEGTDLSVYAEETIRLPRTYWCYEPGGLTPAVVAVPAERAGYVTFGCLNNFSKVSAAALETWAALLARVPDSRLILHASRGPVRARLRAGFAEAGVEGERIEFIDKQDWDGYIDTYSRIDIGLDPFPYGGGITTCDALWMGVPVVTLSGQTAVGRGGRSILANLGLEELVAADRDAYVEIAVALAEDVVRLASLRSSLRAEMEASPLRDPVALAKDLEAAYVEMTRLQAAASAVM